MSSRYLRYHFENQHEKEEILDIIHRHWFGIFLHFVSIILITLFLLGSFLLQPLLFPQMNGAGTARFFSFIQNTLFIFIWLYGFLIWIDYYFDVWIITNERVVNIEQKGLFVRVVSELRFDRIQDVTSTVTGLIPTVLNYGDVAVQTAAEEERFVFRQVPDPYHIKDLLMKLSKSSMNEDLREMAASMQALPKITPEISSKA